MLVSWFMNQLRSGFSEMCPSFETGRDVYLMVQALPFYFLKSLRGG